MSTDTCLACGKPAIKTWLGFGVCRYHNKLVLLFLDAEPIQDCVPYHPFQGHQIHKPRREDMSPAQENAVRAWEDGE
jgi:hypothetical protein